VVLLPALVFFFVLIWNYTRVPIIDDWDQIFAFALKYHAEPSAHARLAMIFSEEVGLYKLMVQNLVIAAQLTWIGRVSLPVMVWTGNLFLLPIFVLMAAHAEGGAAPKRERLLLLLPVSCLLFGLNYAETLDWASCGLQGPIVICCSYAPLHFLSKQQVLWACLLAIVPGLTFPNGMLVWPIGYTLMLMTQRKTFGLVNRLSAWTVACAVSVSVFLFHFSNQAAVTSGTLVRKALFLVMFVGSGMENMHHRPIPYISVLIGCVVLGSFAHAVRHRYDLRNPFGFYAAVWTLGTALIVANGRTSLGVAVSLSSRYKIHCDLLLVFCFVYWLDRLRGNAAQQAWFLRVATVLAVLYFVVGTVGGARMLAARKLRCEAAWHRYLAAPGSASPMALVDDGALSADEVAAENRARVQMNEMVREGIFLPPQ